ncbi:hypothetical protein BT67DRAFT_439873 [Trichocladium antarcticum]|uniref:Uncharacterized protein n=1 Tax=Trichocladium antarcticum TaxID=1450529 RepID=A0AAN6ZGL4_9PEZI|nr:hypothetical protein BT67DRAFT_439873 [Trichocladium antarcticum]
MPRPSLAQVAPCFVLQCTPLLGAKLNFFGPSIPLSNVDGTYPWPKKDYSSRFPSPSHGCGVRQGRLVPSCN